MERKRAISLMRAVYTNDGSAGALLEATPSEAWRGILSQMQLLELGPLFFSHLTRTSAASHVPAEVLRRLQEAYFLHAARNTIILEDLRAILRIFALQGIDAVVLKGACLAGTVYDDIALRPMHDIDLLIREQDLFVVQTVLLGMGYGPSIRPQVAEQIQRHHHLVPFTRPGRPSVEIHVRLTPQRSPCAMDMDGFWARAQGADFGGLRALTLSPEDLILHLCLHFSLNHWFSILELKNLCDISETVKRYNKEIDWKVLGERARGYGVGRYVYCTLRLAAELFGAQLRFEELSCIGDDVSGRQMTDLLADLLLDETSIPLPGAMEQMDREGCLASKTRVLARNVVPPLCYLARKYGVEETGARRLLYLRHWADGGTRAGKFFWGLLRGSRRERATMSRRRVTIRINNWLRSGSSHRSL